MPQFHTEDDWKTVGECEAILRDASQLTLVFPNEEKLNGVHGPVMRKFLHDRFSRIRLINTEQWSSGNEITHPTRSEVNFNAFTKA